MNAPIQIIITATSPGTAPRVAEARKRTVARKARSNICGGSNELKARLYEWLADNALEFTDMVSAVGCLLARKFTYHQVRDALNLHWKHDAQKRQIRAVIESIIQAPTSGATQPPSGLINFINNYEAAA